MCQHRAFARPCGANGPAAPLLLMVITMGVLCSGCGNRDWQASTYPAHGRVTINGEPPAGAVIELQAADQAVDVRNSRPWAIVQEDGTFSLSTYKLNDGAPAGEYAVTIRWPPEVSQPSLADRLNYAFTSAERSQWKVNIAEGENELPPIEIVGAKVLSKEQAGSSPTAAPGPMMGSRR